MEDFIEFQGKNLDSVIDEACDHFDMERGKLEIEILEDAKSGIFGIVGARKARVRARVASITMLKTAPPKASSQEKQASHKQTSKNKSNAEAHSSDCEEDESQSQFFSKIDKHVESLQMNTVMQEELDEHTLERMDREAAVRVQTLGNGTEAEIRAKKQTQRSKPKTIKPKQAHTSHNKNSSSQTKPESTTQYEHKRLPKPPRELKAETEENPSLPRTPLAELDQEKLIQISTDIFQNLLKGIVDPDTVIDIHVESDQLKVRIDSQDTGLLIGREGQNLAAIQYLSTRMIARKMEAQVRVHVDTGDYHSRQDSRIQESALFLADRVRTLGRPQSTRPMSAYQRRIVHLALQEFSDIYTRSSGEGHLKRVIILPKKNDGSAPKSHDDKQAEEMSMERMGTEEMNIEDMGTEEASMTDFSMPEEKE